MERIIENIDDIPKDLEPGTYCTRLVSMTLTHMVVSVILPPQRHKPLTGCCLVQLIQAAQDSNGQYIREKVADAQQEG